MQDNEEEKKEIFTKICLLISRVQLEGSYSNLECGLPCIVANSTVNLVPFGEDIKELQMQENCEVVAPVNILTLFIHAPFSWAIDCKITNFSSYLLVYFFYN